MPTYKYELKPPTPTSLERIKEVQFYLFLKGFLYKYGRENRYMYSLIEILAGLYDCRPDTITLLVDSFKTPGYAPTNTELAVAGFHLGIPVRNLQNLLGMASKTYYRHLNQYLDEGQYDLEPRLSEPYREELFNFIKNASIMFSDVSKSVQGIDIYDRY